MKKISISVLALLLCGSTMAQNVGINTNMPDNSAALHVDATNKGLLIPRMSKSDRGTISLPANGLLIYQTDDSPGFYYNSGTAGSPVWLPVAGSSSGAAGASIYGNGASALNVSSGTVDWTTTPPASLDLQYSSITISAGATLKVPSGTKLRCNGNVSISGTIEVAPSANTNAATIGEKGIARTPAVYSIPTFVAQAMYPAMISSLIDIPIYGGGSGAGGSTGETNGGGGGGSFAIYASGTIGVNSGGSIRANGAHGVNINTSASVNGSGGGGGGLIVLMGKSGITVSGSVQANGGNGSNGLVPSGTGSTRSGGGGGGGGVVCLVSNATPVVSGTITLNAGTGGSTGAGSNSTTQSGGNGGASGGNGGVSSVTSGVLATAGSLGIYRTIVVSNPENLY